MEFSSLDGLLDGFHFLYDVGGAYQDVITGFQGKHADAFVRTGDSALHGQPVGET